MKKVLIHIKLQILTIAILLACVFYSFAQQGKQIPRYSSDFYKVAFQIPDDITKQTESTEKRAVFIGEKSRFGTKARLEFVVNEQTGAAGLSQLMSTDEGIAALANAEIRQMKDSGVFSEFTVLEKKRIQIAGLNGYELVYSAVIQKVKFRSASFVVAIPEQKRMYSFIIVAPDEGFDKWFSHAETAVKSFVLLKAKSE